MKIYRSLTIDLHSGEVLHEDSYEYQGPLALCDRGLNKTAKTAASTASTTASGLGSQANQISSSLVPGLEREAASPEGYTPQEMNNQLVAGEQGAGGATSGVTGQANLTAARTRNAGGYGAALDEAARRKTQALSGNALNVENKSADLGQEKQQGAQKLLSGLYGTDTSGMLDAMGLVPKDVEAGAEANKSGWLQDVTQIGDMLANGVKAYGSVKNG